MSYVKKLYYIDKISHLDNSHRLSPACPAASVMEIMLASNALSSLSTAKSTKTRGFGKLSCLKFEAKNFIDSNSEWIFLFPSKRAE